MQIMQKATGLFQWIYLLDSFEFFIFFFLLSPFVFIILKVALPNNGRSRKAEKGDVFGKVDF